MLKKKKKEMDTKQTKTEKAFSQAQQAVNGLFMNTQHSMLRIETTMQDILLADNRINSIPYVYSKWLPNEPGMNYNMFTDLKNQISQAYSLYKNRNMIQNGNFINGLTNWYASSDAEIQQIDGTSVLVLPNWSTQVSQQNIQLQPNHKYMLRVTAKKEGMGNGYVKVSDCANNVETLTFKSSDINNSNMWNESIGYMTKTMYITPHTSQVRIDIGETEGTFKVNSVELIYMKN